MAWREYGKDNGDGTVTIWRTDDAGNFQPVRTESKVVNQAAPGSSAGGRSTADMLAGLDSAAGGYWNGDRTNPDAVAAAYAAASQGGGGYGGYGGPMGANMTAAQLAEQQAEFTKSLAEKQAEFAVDSAIRQGQLDVQKLAQIWDQTYQTSLLTGTYNGQPTLAAQGQRNDEAIRLMQLQASLSGPANAFKYAQNLTGTPGGLADIVRAAQGGYTLPVTGGGNGMAPTPMSIGSIVNDISQYSPTAAPPAAPGAPTPPASYSTKNGAKTLDQMRAELRTANWPGDPNNTDAVVAAYASTTGGPVTPGGAPPPPPPPAMGQQTVTGTGTGGSAGGYVPSYGALPPINQINPANYQAMNPSQRDLFTAAYTTQGYLPQDFNDIYQKSLKGYGGPVAGAVGF